MTDKAPKKGQNRVLLILWLWFVTGASRFRRRSVGGAARNGGYTRISPRFMCQLRQRTPRGCGGGARHRQKVVYMLNKYKNILILYITTITIPTIFVPSSSRTVGEGCDASALALPGGGLRWLALLRGRICGIRHGQGQGRHERALVRRRSCWWAVNESVTREARRNRRLPKSLVWRELGLFARYT